jgi:hypothetical protein
LHGGETRHDVEAARDREPGEVERDVDALPRGEDLRDADLGG